MEGKTLFTTQEVAAELSISDARVRRMIATGQAHPSHQVGGTWVFTKDELDRLRSRPKSKGGRPKK